MSERMGDDRLIVEYGAGRMHRQRHRRLHELCSELGLPLAPFSYPAQLRQPGEAATAPVRPDYRSVVATLIAAGARESDRRRSFADFCTEVVGAPQARDLQRCSGYDTLLHPRLPVEAGLSILCHHPETESLFHEEGSGAQWFTLQDGFQDLAWAVAMQLAGDIEFSYRSELRHVEPATGDDGGYLLEFAADGVRRIERAGAVILATPLQNTQLLSGLDKISPRHASTHLEAVPLMKGVVQFDRAWWPASERSRCVIADTPLRKLYLTGGSHALWFYCDGASARRMHSLLRGETSFPLALVEQHLGVALPCDVRVRRSRWKFWEHGISFDSEARTDDLDRGFNEIAPGLAICSDVYTDHLGWIEGGLESAEAIARHWQGDESCHRAPAPLCSMPLRADGQRISAGLHWTGSRASFHDSTNLEFS